MEINKAVKDKLKIVFTTYIMVGLITHGIALFNKISFHDDTMETLLGASYTSGRWSIYIIDELRGFLFGTKFVSSPCFNGCVTLILFAFVTYILIEAFHISNRISLILISALLSSFPYFATLFAYMFTAWVYGVCFMIAAVACYFLCNKHNRTTFIIGTVALAFSVGIYQAVIPFILSFFVIHEIIKLDYIEKSTWGDFFKDVLYYAGNCFAFMSLYVLIEQWFLWKFEVSLTNYQGIGEVGNISMKAYLYRILVAYKRFFQPIRFTGGDVFPGRIYYLYFGVILAAEIGTLSLLKRNYHKSKTVFIQILLCVLLMPMTINFVFVMCDEKVTIIHVLMQYAQIFIFIWILYLLERGYFFTIKYQNKCIFKNLTFVLLGSIVIGQSRFDNSVYIKNQYLQNQAICYFTTLITRIQSVQNYKEDYPIIFLNSKNKSTKLTFEIPGGGVICIFIQEMKARLLMTIDG